MLNLLVDSTVWIDYFNGALTPQTDYLDAALGVEPIVVGDLILMEVLQGFRRDADYEAAKAALLSFPVFEMGGVDLALQSAQHYRQLRRQGITIRKPIDCLIATFCLTHNLRLLHNDRDFEPFETVFGLRVEHPAA